MLSEAAVFPRESHSPLKMIMQHGLDSQSDIKPQGLWKKWRYLGIIRQCHIWGKPNTAHQHKHITPTVKYAVQRIMGLICSCETWKKNKCCIESKEVQTAWFKGSTVSIRELCMNIVKQKSQRERIHLFVDVKGK